MPDSLPLHIGQIDHTPMVHHCHFENKFKFAYFEIGSDHYSAECAKGIWSTRIDPHLNSSLNDLLFQDRKDRCFFIEAHKGMSFEAASELHRLRNDNRQLKQSYRYTQIGLWIAATGVVASVIMRVLEKLGWIPQ